jgi:hypothetical protein
MLVVWVVAWYNSGGMPASIHDQNKIVVTGTEQFNPGGESLRSSASPPEALCVPVVVVVLVVAWYNSGGMPASIYDQNKIVFF